MQSHLQELWKKVLLDREFVEKCERDGVDLSLLSNSLAMSPTERAERNKALLGILAEARKNRPKRNFDAIT